MSQFFGGHDGFLMVLLTFMVIDQFSGLAAGWAEHKIFGEAETSRNIISTFYIANEGISIIENADRLGIPIPDFIRDRFLNLKKLRKKLLARMLSIPIMLLISPSIFISAPVC